MNKNRLIVLAAVALVMAAIMAGCCTRNDILGGGQLIFAYVSNEASNDVSAYSIDATSGALTAVTGSPFTGESDPRGVAVTPSGKFLYMANAGSNNISAYSIDAASGALTQVTGSPFPEGETEEDYGPRGVAVDPSGKFVYVANENSDNVSAFSIDATSGALTQVTGSPFPDVEFDEEEAPVATGPRGVAVDPSGKFVYVTNHLSDDVSAYSINATSGALTPVPGSPFVAENTPFGVAVDPSGKFVYVTNHLSGNVSAYTLNAATGALTQITGSPFASGSQPHGVVVDPLGKFVYVANHGSANVSAYSINATSGALTELAGSPFDAGSGPYGLAVDLSGKFLYVANNSSGTVSAYSINATSGALTPLAGSPFVAGSGPHGVAVARHQ